MKRFFAIAITSLLLMAACSAGGPEPFNLGKESCSYCKMTISDPRFGAEIITTKGKVYKFDDMRCLNAFLKENNVVKNDIKEMYAVNFCGDHNLVKADENLLLFKCDELQSPMGGNIAAFNDRDSIAVMMKQYKKGIPLNWDELIK